MKRFIHILFSIAALAAADGVSAQTTGDFRRRLAEPATDETSGRTARVEIYESPDAAAAVAAAAANAAQNVHFQGYRLGIYSGNGPSAHEDSLAAKESFEENYPGINVYWVYDNPYFKVTAGDCLTEEEAVMLLERVRKLFPKAYVVRAEMSASDILLPEPKESESEADTEPAE